MRQLYGIHMVRASGMASTASDQVYSWAALGESETQEFKVSTGQRSEAAKTLCAFLNLKGGRILFGVDPTGSVVGQEVTERTLEKVYREIEQFDPEIMPSIERVLIEVDVLRGFGLIKGKELLNAAVVLFGRSDRLLPGYTQCLLKLTRFDGIEKGDRMADERQVHGHAFALLRQAEAFLRDHLRVSAFVEHSTVRVDEPEIPMVALREALANAISHREYATGAGSISVNIFDDRVEVTSVGPLHFGLSVADLYRPHESQPWNPLIAGTLYRRGIIDSLGSGTLRMLRACRDAGLFEPDIQDSGTSVRVDFPRAGAPPARFHGLDLNDNSHELLRLIVRNGSMALRELVAALPAMSERDVREELQRLRHASVLEPQGHGRGARWVLAPPPG
ncbi:MAG: ATP-binding protein [Pseudonocardiaceae bacterium]